MKYGLILTCILALGASGCATKKFVRNSLDPLSRRVNTMESQNKDQTADIGELQTSVSRADERAISADQKAEDAAKQAQSANTRAEESGRSASNATSLARQGLSGLDAVGSRIDGLSDYQLVMQETVTFGLGSSQLTEDARRVLDEAAASVVPDAPCIIEVLGFTDTSGDPTYNLALSERRAKEVVRYLVGQHDIPLRKIHMLGLGSEDPATNNETREGRQGNRRVEVRVFIADEAATLIAESQ